MTTATDPGANSRSGESGPGELSVLDTGPQAVLRLAEQGLTQRDIAEALGISQPTVVRRIREAKAAADEARANQRKAALQLAVITLLTLCAIVATAALASLAWA